MLRFAVCSAALAGVWAFVDTTAKPNVGSVDFNHEESADASTAFRAAQNQTAPDFWRRKPNNGSPYLCDVSLYNWFAKLGNESTKGEKTTILDVGGGYGVKGDNIEKWNPHKFKYSCIDVTAQGRCTEFDGEKIHHKDKSFDVVTFVYSLHHAGDASFELLREAKRVAKKYVVVLDDLTGETDHTLNFQFGHGGCQFKEDEPRVCMFRSDREWREIFGFVGLRVQYAADLKELFHCEENYKIKRGFYVLEPAHPKDFQFLSADEQRSFRVTQPANALAPVLS